MRCFVLIFFTVLLLYACQGGGATVPTKEERITSGDTVNAFNAIPVTVAKAARKQFEHQISGRGKLEAVRQVQLAFGTTGTLAEVAIQNGERVKEGRLLARLENTRALIAVKRAENEVLVKQDDYQLLLNEFQMVSGDTTLLNTAQKRSMLARSGLGAARIALEEAVYNLRQTELLAPFNGTVSEIELQPGAQVMAGGAFCKLHDPDRLHIKVPVLENDLPLLREGLSATVSILALPGKKFRASLVHIAPMVGEDNQVQVTVEIQLPPAHPLLPGMNALVTLQVPLGKSLVVPKEAVVVRSGRPVVFCLQNGLAKWHYVETGSENSTEIQILDGLEGEPTVIVGNNLQLAHDAPVEVTTAQQQAVK